jgi:hypothetical protein
MIQSSSRGRVQRGRVAASGRREEGRLAAERALVTGGHVKRFGGDGAGIALVGLSGVRIGGRGARRGHDVLVGTGDFVLYRLSRRLRCGTRRRLGRDRLGFGHNDSSHSACWVGAFSLRCGSRCGRVTNNNRSENGERDGKEREGIHGVGAWEINPDTSSTDCPKTQAQAHGGATHSGRLHCVSPGGTLAKTNCRRRAAKQSLKSILYPSQETNTGTSRSHLSGPRWSGSLAGAVSHR